MEILMTDDNWKEVLQYIPKHIIIYKEIQIY